MLFIIVEVAGQRLSRIIRVGGKSQSSILLETVFDLFGTIDEHRQSWPLFFDERALNEWLAGTFTLECIKSRIAAYRTTYVTILSAVPDFAQTCSWDDFFW